MSRQGEPKEPKKQKRRGNRDLYEVLALFLWIVFLSGTICLAIMSKGSWFDEYDVTWNNMLVIIYALAGLWALCSVSLYLFDKKSVIREKEEYELKSKHYRARMDAWQERVLAEMELEKQRLISAPSFEEELTQIKKKLEEELENKKKLEAQLEKNDEVE